MTKKPYYQLLKDPRWQKKRLKILERDNFRCLVCNDTETELRVHHLSYSGNPWDVTDDQLKTVCLHCHGEIENTKKHWKSNGINPLPFEFFINRFNVTKYISNNYTLVVYKLIDADICSILEFNNVNKTFKTTFILKDLKVYNSF